MRPANAHGNGGAARDAAFADLITLESRRMGLEAAVRAGGTAARGELTALRPQLSKQAVIAADLDRAFDLAAAEAATAESIPNDCARRVEALCERRLALARNIETHVEAVAAACHDMAAVDDAFRAAGIDAPAVLAELSRFRDQFCFYVETVLDFMTGACGMAGHPSYRRLTEVMLDGEAVLKLYRRTVGGRGEVDDAAVQPGRSCPAL